MGDPNKKQVSAGADYSRSVIYDDDNDDDDDDDEDCRRTYFKEPEFFFLFLTAQVKNSNLRL